MSDCISLFALALTASIGPDHWDRPRAQPVLLTVHVDTPLARAGGSDDVAHTIHYGRLAEAMLALQTAAFPSLVHLAHAAADAALAPPFAAERVRVLAEAPKLLLQAHSLAVELARGPAPAPPQLVVHVNELALHTLVGVNAPERVHRQQVLTTVSFREPDAAAAAAFPHRAIADRLAEHIENSRCLTLEAFATSVAAVACFLDGMDLVTVQAQKPSAVALGRASGVQITRDRAFFQRAAASRVHPS